MIAVKGQACTHLPFFTIREIKRTTDHLNAVGLHGVLARARHCADLAVLRGIQQTHHLIFADLHIRFEVNHPAIDRRRKLPDFAVDTATDFLIEIDTVSGNQHRDHDP